jgi:outer membrane biogenesis lipoprotein LolB
MAKQQKLFFIAHVASVLLAACSSDAAKTVYDVLEKNNLLGM